MAAVFVLPATTAGQQGPVAALLSTAGWASAAERVVGSSWILTPSGYVDPEEARRRGTAAHLSSEAAPTWRRRIPTAVKTAGKDARMWLRATRLRVDPRGPWGERPVAFVWQRHELFHTTGPALARSLGVPSVLFVPATLVWEGRQWGVTRPAWGRLLERTGERPALRAADLVACGSSAVAEQVVRLGTDERRVLITPTGVDLDLFSRPQDPGALRRTLGLDGRFVVGWVGSFRRFHALQQAVDAVVGIEDASLLLVGDGPERPGIERYVRERGVHAVFTGTVAHTDLPQHLRVMDAALVLASAGGSFHYSPLKLAEYLASGLAVVAPAVAQLEERLSDGDDVLFVPAGDTAAIRRALLRLHRDLHLRARLSANARATAEREWSWDHQVQRVLDALD